MTLPPGKHLPPDAKAAALQRMRELIAQDYNSREIAHVLGVTEGVVRQWWRGLNMKTVTDQPSSFKRRRIVLAPDQGVLLKGTPVHRVGVHYFAYGPKDLTTGFLSKDVDTTGKPVSVNIWIKS